MSNNKTIDSGELFSWGYNQNGQLGIGVGQAYKCWEPVKVGEFPEWVKISCSESHSAILTQT